MKITAIAAFVAAALSVTPALAQYTNRPSYTIQPPVGQGFPTQVYPNGTGGYTVQPPVGQGFPTQINPDGMGGYTVTPPVGSGFPYHIYRNK